MTDQTLYPSISIITPSYNQGKFIEKTILSIINQDYPALEYIVVDGGSTDKTHEIIKKYRSKISNIIIESDRGQSDAINKGINKATGEWIGWINSDDMLASDALIKIATEIEKNPDWKNIFMGKYSIVDVNGNQKKVFQSCIRTLEELVDIPGQWRGIRGNQIGQQGVFFSKRLFKKVGGLNIKNHYSMDYELWGKMFLAGGRIVPVNEVLGIFRTYDGQKISDRLATTRSLLKSAKSLIHNADHWSFKKKAYYIQKLLRYEWKFNYHRLRSAVGIKRRFKELFDKEKL